MSRRSYRQCPEGADCLLLPRKRQKGGTQMEVAQIVLDALAFAVELFAVLRGHH